MSEEKELTPLKRLIRLLSPDSREIRNVYTYAIFSGLVSLTLPLGIQAIVNLIQGGKVSTSWILLVVLVVAGVGLNGMLQIFQLRIVENLQQKIFAKAAFEFSYRVPRIKMEELYKQYAPELMNRFFDVMSIQKGLSKILIDFTAASLQVVFGLILLSFYHPFFILFSLLLAIIVYVIFKLTAKHGLKTSLKESKLKYETAHWLEELARTNITFKLAGDSKLPLQKTDANVEKYLEAREDHFQVLIKQFSLLVLFKVLVATGLLAIGGILVMEQLMNIGQFVAAEIIILMIMNSVEKLILALETIYDVLTGVEKVGEVTDLELEHVEGANLEHSKHTKGINLKVKNLTFQFPNTSYPILEKVNFEIKSNNSLIITGPNASGKSTLLHLIAGLYQVSNGQILYDDLSKANISMESLRTVIGDCLSQEMLFQGTVKENISMGREISTEQLKKVIAKTKLTDYINTLSLGFDSELDPQGKRLPKSIVQRLLIARAIANNPKLLIIEENLENINEEDRNEIIDYLMDKSNNWTLIAASNDPYFQSKADHILTLSDGKIEHLYAN
jgi:ABC-type bacteriocin/lantibiotic exporter with double-glycine peptidase domain